MNKGGIAKLACGAVMEGKRKKTKFKMSGLKKLMV